MFCGLLIAYIGENDNYLLHPKSNHQILELLKYIKITVVDFNLSLKFELKKEGEIQHVLNVCI